MNMHRFKLESLYQDLCHRYGPQDSAVQDLLRALESISTPAPTAIAMDRRTVLPGGHVWNRADKGATAPRPNAR